MKTQWIRIMKKLSFDRIITLVLIIPGFLLISCQSENQNQDTPQSELSWQEIEAKAKGKTVYFMMLQGDKGINSYIDSYVVPELLSKYDIKLKIIPGQGSEIVSGVLAEKEAGENVGKIDLCWINGETFYQLRQIDGLMGPYTDKLPNSRYIDFEDPIIKYDFQKEINGYETPWGKASFFMICDTARVKNPPRTMDDFEAFWKANPGQFTFDTRFSGITLMKTWLIELAGDYDILNGPFDNAKYEKYSTQLWDFINRNKTNFWRRGETFPATGTPISQMYSNGELTVISGFGLRDLDRKVLEGVYPATSKAYILDAGTIHNTNYVGIPFNAPNKEAAMVVCNFLISPEAQIKKSDLSMWGATPILDFDKVEDKWVQKYDAMPQSKYAPNEAEIKAKSLSELDSEYMIRMADDFRKYVILEN